MTRKLTILCLALLVVFSSLASDVCIQPTATGNRSGSDWTNARTNLPTTVTRGDVYYLGSGSILLDDMIISSSGARVTFIKATADNHGPSTGWNNTFTNQMRLIGNSWNDYSGWTWNGVYRGTNTGDSSTYGIYFDGTASQKILSFGRKSGTISDSNFLMYCWFEGNGSSLGITDLARYLLDWYSGAAVGTYNTNYVGYCGFTNGANAVFFSGNTGFNVNSNMTIENCYFGSLAGNAANHGEFINGYYTAHNVTVRNNIFRGARGGVSSVFAVGGNASAQYGIKFYGNLIYDCEVSTLIGFDETDRANFVGARVYNNTIAKPAGGWIKVSFSTGSDNLVMNNIFFDCESGFNFGASVTHSNNVFSWNYSETAGTPNAPSSIFTDYVNNVYTLASNPNTGVDVGEPYNVDAYNHLRGGTNGTYSSGAYQLFTGSSPAPTQTFRLRNGRVNTLILQ